MGACTLDRDWPTYVVVSLVTLFGGVAILLPLRIGWWKVGEHRQSLAARHRSVQTMFARLRTAGDVLMAGNTVFSKIIMIGFWLVDIVASAIYLTEATLVNIEKVDECGSITNDPVHYVWISAMCVCLIRFVIKFVASNDKLLMWIDLYSLVDHFTIGPTLVGIYYDKNWLGLRFLRLVYLLNTADILQMIYILRSRNGIRIVKALTAVISVWTFGAGMYHLLENNGDPFFNYENQQPVSYWNCVYLVLITLTTIGYGDISPRTVLGKAFTVVFVVLALATFGTLVPELGKALSSHNRYRKAYKRKIEKRHLVISGGITFETLTTVVKNFIHEDSSVDKTDIVIIDINKPSAELRAFFRRHFNDVTFIQGTVLDIPTLKLAKTHQADAVLILANRRAEDEDEEDTANIMRATAIKNLSSDVRIILQLLQHHNKEQLLHIPGWNWQRANSSDITMDGDDITGSDEVICISELKMGFMAQNCLAPGIVTILSNLICMRSYKPKNTRSWMNDYCYGAGHEIYAGTFSKDFIGRTFTDTAVVCLREYGVLLVAVNCPQANGTGSKLRVNPGNGFCIEAGQVGFFIAQGPNEVSSVSCHRMTNIGSQLSVSSSTKLITKSEKCKDDSLLQDIDTSFTRPVEVHNISTANEDDNNNEQDLFDVTNMFHWSPTRSLESATLKSDSVNELKLTNHFIFVLTTTNKQTTSSCQELGLVNFVKPLRTSSILTHRLQTIVFYADPNAVQLEWNSIANFPHVFIFPRSRSISSDLRLLGVKKCSMCLVLGPSDVSKIDETLVDKQSILTTKNILSLRNIEDKVARIGVFGVSEKFSRQLSTSVPIELPLLIELEHDASVAYIDDDDDDDPSVPLFQTLPYVCGKVLLASVLDSMVAAAYMNTDILMLIRALLTGGDTPEFERVLTEGVGITEQGSVVRNAAARCRSSLALLSLKDSLLRHIEHEDIYGQLVTKSLQNYGLLCIGLYRLVPDQQTQKRYVITHPAFNFKLTDSDKVYVLKPFEFDSNSSISVSDDITSNNDITPPLMTSMKVVDSETPL